MSIFNDPRLDPVDINASEDYFPPETTPEVMALHMTRRWKALTSSTDDHALDAIYAMWLTAYRAVEAWHEEHPASTVREGAAEARRIFTRVCRDYGIPNRMRGVPPSNGVQR